MTLLTDLVAANVLSEEEASKLSLLLNDSEKNPELYLKVLHQLLQSNLFGGPPKGWVHVGVGNLSVRSNSSVEPCATSDNSLLNILIKYQMISRIVYDKLSRVEWPDHKNSHFIILHLARELNYFYQEFSIDKQVEFAELLGGRDHKWMSGMLDERAKKKLLKDIKLGKPENYLDFFKYCYSCLMVDLASYVDHPEKALKKLTKVINDLCYGAFTLVEVRMIEADFQGSPSYHNKQVTLSMDTGSRVLNYTYEFSGKDTRAPFETILLLENLLTFTNQLLADYNCNYRFTGVKSKLNDELFPNTKQRYAICRVEQGDEHIFEFYGMQARFLYNQPHLNYRLPFSYMHIEYAIHHFKACGLLAHLDDEKINEVITRIHENTYIEAGDLLVAFPATIAIVTRDLVGGQKPYQDFLLSLNRISMGVLNFSDIKDEFPERYEYNSIDEFKLSFSINGRHHEVQCNVAGGQFDDSLIRYIITEIVRKEFAGYHLTQMIAGNHLVDYFLFVTDKQNSYLEKMKLLTAINRF